MNITKHIIHDLLPLYAANECSADTRALVEEYLRAHPDEAEKLQRLLNDPLSRTAIPPSVLDETRSFREARRRLRRRSGVMGLAIFFSLAPLSFFYSDGRSWWLLRDSPRSALAYAAIGVALWIYYLLERRKSNSL